MKLSKNMGFVMRKVCILLVLVVLLAGCEEGAADLGLEAAAVYESAGVCSVEEDGAYAFHVYPRLDSIGPSGNELIVGEDFIWIVESGSNTVRRVEKGSGRVAAQFIDVGNERNPYGMYVDEVHSEVFIANYAANTLTVADAGTGEVLEEIGHASLQNPSGVTVTDKYIYVTNVHFLGVAQGYGEGSVTVLDRATREVLGNLPTAHKNPQYITQLETVDGLQVVISNGGALRRGAGGVFVESEGSLEFWKEGDEPLRPEVEVYPLGQLAEPGLGAPGRAQVTSDGRWVYAMSGISTALFKLDLQEKRWVYAVDSPLVLYEAAGETTHSLAMGAGDLLYITSFNQDALYVLDTSCDEILMGSIDLGTTGNMLEGPQSVAVDVQGEFTRVYFLMSVSNVLGKVDVYRKN